LLCNWKVQGVFDTDNSRYANLATYLEAFCHTEHGRTKGTFFGAFRVSWMDRYQGLTGGDNIFGGGAYVANMASAMKSSIFSRSRVQFMATCKHPVAKTTGMRRKSI